MLEPSVLFCLIFIFVVFVVVFHLIPLGIVRVEQKNNTFFDMNIFEDGPYEVGGETDHDESLVPVPANSYLGRSKQRSYTCQYCETLHLRAQGWEQTRWEPGALLHLLQLDICAHGRADCLLTDSSGLSCHKMDQSLPSPQNPAPSHLEGSCFLS